HLPGDLARERRRVESRAAPHPAHAAAQRIPVGVYPDPDGGDDPQPRDDDAPHDSLPTQRARRAPPAATPRAFPQLSGKTSELYATKCQGNSVNEKSAPTGWGSTPRDPHPWAPVPSRAPPSGPGPRRPPGVRETGNGARR